MTRLLARPLPFKGWVSGLVQDTEPGVLPIGTIEDGQNMVPLAAGHLATRGGSRILLTLHDDAGSPAELSHACLVQPFTPVGAVVVGWSDGQNKHYAYRLTADGVFSTGTEATSRTSLTAAPSTTWNNGSTPARPVAAELFEKLFLADATLVQANRNEFLSFDSTGTVLRPTFSFAGGGAAALLPYCLEEYNGVLFIAGYGDESGKDRPEIVRHSFLARSPDDVTGGAEGFHKDAYNLLGAKGQRVTALRKGKGLLLAAKDNELYRISGFGRAYAGWQYQVDTVDNMKGLGVSNPHALTYAEGFWYGVGARGPMRTDGYSVESLVGPRQRGWRGMDNVATNYVEVHPERRLILFGVHPTEASSGRSATYPWVQWVWDLERQVWQPDWLFGADFFMVRAIPTTTSVGPTAAPSNPSTGSETTDGYTASWTNGDASAETEFWEKTDTTGTWTLVTVLAAGTATYARTGDIDHTAYYWRVRHRKSSVFTSYTADTVAKTLIAPPTLAHTCVTSGGGGGSVHTRLSYTVAAGIVTVVIELSGVPYVTVTGVATGTYFLTVPNGTYRSKASDAAWPTTMSVYSGNHSAVC